MKRLLFPLFLSVGLYAQTSPEYTPSIGPPVTPYTLLNYRDVSNNVEYICRALSNQPTYTWTKSAATLTSIAVSTNTATFTFSSNHGLLPGNVISVSGATVDTDLNGTYVVVTGGTTTLTVTTVNVANATYTEATLAAWTTAPRTNAGVWSIQRNFYTTTYLDRSTWAGGSTALVNACDSRTGYAYN
jgi:hypothetical protein